MTSTAPKPTRSGQTQKRAAILGAARELFVRDGVERTSMDAVSARAGVSKRTVYDYYGDKRGLLLGVVVDAGESLVETIRRTIHEHLSDDATIADAPALERALTAYACSIGDAMLGSSDYAATVRLISENSAMLTELEQHPLNTAPEEALAERIAHFVDAGLLEVDDVRLATDHFTALTTLLAWNSGLGGAPTAESTRASMRAGVHAFMRAYGRDARA